MKKLRNEKPELSKKSPFYITKHRYYELKNFCLQYPDWKKALEQVNGWESNSHEVSGIVRGTLPESSTERQAMIRAYYSMHIDIIDRCVAKLEPAIAPYSLLKNGNLKLSEHFKVREFYCRDGSDPIFVDTELVEILEKIRTHFNKPVTITSAFRTASWNAKQKNAAKYSQHLYGKAADIQVQGISVEQVYAYADKLLAGRGGVGIYPPGLGRANGWVHVDVRKEKSRWRG